MGDGENGPEKRAREVEECKEKGEREREREEDMLFRKPAGITMHFTSMGALILL